MRASLSSTCVRPLLRSITNRPLPSRTCASTVYASRSPLRLNEMSPTDPRKSERPVASSCTTASVPRAAFGPPGAAWPEPVQPRVLRQPAGAPPEDRGAWRCVELTGLHPLPGLRASGCEFAKLHSRRNGGASTGRYPRPRPAAGRSRPASLRPARRLWRRSAVAVGVAATARAAATSRHRIHLIDDPARVGRERRRVGVRHLDVLVRVEVQEVERGLASAGNVLVKRSAYATHLPSGDSSAPSMLRHRE